MTVKTRPAKDFRPVKHPIRTGKPSCGERPTCVGCAYARMTGCARAAGG